LQKLIRQANKIFNAALMTNLPTNTQMKTEDGSSENCFEEKDKT
jgi:hypothetical protein